MTPGDYVLTYQDGRYTYWSQVIETLHNKALARAIWGRDGGGDTWEYMYFLQPPRNIDVPLEDENTIGYDPPVMGFMRVADDRTERVREEYGSIQTFVEERLGDPTYLLIRSNEDTEWDDEKGRSYHFGQTVSNYTQIEKGAKFLIDRRFDDGSTRIVAKGQFGSVEHTGTNEDGTDDYRARYIQHEWLLPPRLITDEEQYLLEQQESYNRQHSIRRLSRAAYKKLAQPPTAWIFQANPENFDVRRSVQE
jgi:hypothetical protein